MSLETIKEKEYEQFVKQHETHHFMKSYYFGEVMKHKGFKPHYLGLKKEGVIVAAALLLEKRVKSLSYFYSPRGYTINYSDLVLVNELTKELKIYAKKHKAMFIKIDPNIKRHNQDINGNIDKTYNNYELLDNLKQNGYIHKGFSTEFTDEQPRFTFNIDLDKPFKDIMKGMHATTRNIINRDNPYGLKLYIGTKEDIKHFYQTMKETALRENIVASPIEYYEKFYEILNKHNMSDLYVVKCNINKLRIKYKELIKDVEKRIGEIVNNPNSTKKARNRLNDMNDELNKLNKEMNMLTKIDKEEMILSSMITVKYNDTVWTVHGGNSSQLRNLNSNYLLYYHIIKDANDQDMKVVDLFGTSGIPNPDKHNPIYGIHLFKKRFGGEYVEYIGEFDLICRPILYRLYTIIIPIRRKMIKSILRKKNKKQ